MDDTLKKTSNQERDRKLCYFLNDYCLRISSFETDRKKHCEMVWLFSLAVSFMASQAENRGFKCLPAPLSFWNSSANFYMKFTTCFRLWKTSRGNLQSLQIYSTIYEVPNPHWGPRGNCSPCYSEKSTS